MKVKSEIIEMNIIISEDDTNILNVLEIIVEDIGHKAYTSASVAEFWKLLKQQHADLFILDYWINETKADEIIEKLKSSKEYSDTPILLISAVDNLDEVAKGLDIDASLKKPFNIEELENTIHTLINKK